LRVVQYMGRRVTIASLQDITQQLALEKRLKGKSEATQTKVHKDNKIMLQMAASNNRLYQMVESLKAVPDLSKQLSALDNVNEVIKQACLYITNQETGLQFGSCVIYMSRGDQLEVAYANPFRMTSAVSTKDNETFRNLLDGKVDMVVTDEGHRVVPIHDRDSIIGILEVGIGRTLERIFATDDPVRRGAENVIKAIADFIGGQIANIKLREKIQLQAVEDKLTGLFNRRHFDEKIEGEFKRAARYNRSLALIVLDIDHFKKVNDVHGHAQGDTVLSAIGKLMGGSFRDLDTVCRTGGEEFAILMPETSTEAAVAKADQLRKAVEALQIDMGASKVPHKDGDTMHVTISLGVASVSPAIESADHLYQEADRVLYVAKESGRNRVVAA
ncbi:MAG: GGDEF domain-containing protein, partial [Planctomycetes bacterium]|nr:GGDEF domain-containing protein [Planctomycetota bacterium]